MHYIALSLQTRSHDPRENARRARRKLCSTGLRHDTSKLCYDVACRYSRWASNVAAACSVGAQIFLLINVFIFVISCMRDYVVCVVTLIYTRVRACMHACATLRMHVYTCVDICAHMRRTWSRARVIAPLPTRIHILAPLHLVFKRMRSATSLAWSLARVKATATITEGRYALPYPREAILATCAIERGTPARGA